MAPAHLARKIAAITLIVWKKEVPFERQKYCTNKQLERLGWSTFDPLGTISCG